MLSSVLLPRSDDDDAFLSRSRSRPMGLRMTSLSSVRREEMAKEEEKEEFFRGAAAPAVSFDDGSLLLLLLWLLMGVNPLLDESSGTGALKGAPPFRMFDADNDDADGEWERSRCGGLPRGVGGNFEVLDWPQLLQWARHQASSNVAGERLQP